MLFASLSSLISGQRSIIENAELAAAFPSAIAWKFGDAIPSENNPNIIPKKVASTSPAEYGR